MSFVLNSPLYTITPDIDDEFELLSLVKQAIRGGVRLLQYRNKCSSGRKRQYVAGKLNELLNNVDGKLIINDDYKLAKTVDAYGVHIGSADESIENVQAILGPDKVIGVSCYGNPELALKMESRGASYVAFGSFFSSISKPNAKRASFELFDRTRNLGLRVPIVAIGGITLDNAGLLFSKGVTSVAVINGLFGFTEVEATARAWMALCVQYDPVK